MELTTEQKILAEVIQKAWEDADFKKELMENPIETIENFTGKKVNLPDGKTLVVNDQTDDSKVHLNLPPEVKMEDLELSEEQLENIAGGSVGAFIYLKQLLTGTIMT